MSNMYDQYAKEIEKWSASYRDKTYLELATEEERIDALLSPADYIEEKIVNLATEYEDRILGNHRRPSRLGKPDANSSPL